MLHRATQLTLVLSLSVWPAISFARAPQVTQASAAAAEANAQAASAQASALQAASQQAAAQISTAQNAFREAMQNYAKAPAGAAKTAAQGLVQQAQKQLVTAQSAARTAATQAMAAHSAAAQAAAQAAAAQAALARQAAATPAPAAQPAATPTAASVSHTSPGTPSTAGSSGGSTGKASGGNSTLSTVLGSVFGNGNSAAGASGTKTSKNGTPNANSGQANNGQANGQGNNGQAGAPQGNAFAGSNNGATRGGAQPATAEQQNTPAGQTRKVGAAFANGALGVGQSSDTLLTIYGCSRMGTQVMCDTDLSNQNNGVNQVNSADQWKDVYLQDDVGDNHMRSMGVFENQNGDQRTSITLPYGEKSRYILVFNGVPANVKSVTLKSSKDTLDVEGIPVASPDVPANAQGGAPSQAAPAGMQPASAPAGRTGSRPPHS